MKQVNLKKLLIPNLPYVLIGVYASKIGQAYRLAAGADLSERLRHIGDEGEILLHKAAKKAFDEMGIKKLPTVKSIQAEYAGLLAEKKTLYPEYSAVRQEMKDLQMAKANVARLLGYEEKEKEKENRETMVNEKETTNRADPLL